MRHFLERWPGSFLLSHSVHVYVHKCYWRPLIGCGEKEGGRVTSLYGHRCRREAPGKEMFPGNGGFWIANQQGSSAI